MQGTPYQISRFLAGGAMGEVYLVEHRLLRTKLCVKVLHQELLADDGLVDRFRVEAQALAQLGGGAHPHLVHVRDYGVTAAGLPFLAMEYLVGETLLEVRKARGEVPWREACDWVIQALRGIRVAHEAGIVHRDLKPANLFLVRHDGAPPVIKVLDFGIAKIVSSDAPVEPGAVATAAGIMLGTPRYAAPEQIRAEPVDARSDLYSMGLVLYELLTGLPPYANHRSQHDVLLAQAREVLMPVSRVSKQALPVALDEVVARATAKEPSQRFPSAGAFSAALEAVRDEGAQPVEPLTVGRGRPNAATLKLDSYPALPVPALAVMRAAGAEARRGDARRITAVASDEERAAFADASDRTDHALPWFPVESRELTAAADVAPPAAAPGPGSVTVAEMSNRRQRTLVSIAAAILSTLVFGALCWWAFTRYLR